MILCWFSVCLCSGIEGVGGKKAEEKAEEDKAEGEVEDEEERGTEVTPQIDTGRYILMNQ